MLLSSQLTASTRQPVSPKILAAALPIRPPDPKMTTDRPSICGISLLLAARRRPCSNPTQPRQATRAKTDRAARQGRRWAVSHDRWAAEGRLVAGACALEQARSLGQALRVLLGRRHPRAGQARGRRAVPAGHHRRHARGQEGADRPDRRRARKCAILERGVGLQLGPSSQSPMARSAFGR